MDIGVLQVQMDSPMIWVNSNILFMMNLGLKFCCVMGCILAAKKKEN
jgi:hypothetical protein